MDVIFISLLSFFGAGVGTLTGFGSSTVMLPLLVLVYPFPESLLLAGIVHVFNDIWKIVLFKKGVRWKLIFEFGVPGIIAAVLGGRLALSIPENISNTLLGTFFIGYVLFLLVYPRFQIKHEAWTASVGGVLSGFSAGVFGLGGAIRSVFLIAFDLPKEVYLATIGVIAIFADIGRVTAYIVGGTVLTGALIWGLPLFVVASFVGAKIAQKIIHKIPQERFRTIVAGFLFLVALKLLFF